MEVLKVKQDVSAGALTREELSVLNGIAGRVMENLAIRKREGDGHYDGYNVEFSATISVEDAITLNSARRKTRRMLCERGKAAAEAEAAAAAAAAAVAAAAAAAAAAAVNTAHKTPTPPKDELAQEIRATVAGLNSLVVKAQKEHNLRVSINGQGGSLSRTWEAGDGDPFELEITETIRY